MEVQGETKPDMVNHPPHYTDGYAGYECIDLTKGLPFELGNAIKYLWRAGKKDDAVEDKKKALWYLKRVDFTTYTILTGMHTKGLLYKSQRVAWDILCNNGETPFALDDIMAAIRLIGNPSADNEAIDFQVLIGEAVDNLEGLVEAGIYA